MRLRRLKMVAALSATIFSSACDSKQADDPPPRPAPTAPFEGKVEPSLVGSWVSKGGVSALTLLKDGSLKSESVSTTPNGKSDTVVKGKWLVKGDSLLLQFPDKTKRTTIIQYTYRLAGKTLKLSQGGGRIITDYQRQ